MKKRIFLVLIILSAFFVHAQIPNPSFENWTLVNGILEPDGWQTNNAVGSISVSRDSLSRLGNYAMRITNNSPGIEPEEGIAFMRLAASGLPDTLYFFVHYPIVYTPNAFYMVSALAVGSNPKEENLVYEYSINPTSTYTLQKLPLHFISNPDSVEIKLLVDCTCMLTALDVYFDDFGFQNPFSISELERSASVFTFYPNPASGTVFLRFADANQTVQHVSLLNTAGQMLREIKTWQNGIDLTNLPAGNYFLRVRTNNGTAVQRLVVGKN